MLAALPDRARTPQRLLVASRCMFFCPFCFLESVFITDACLLFNNRSILYIYILYIIRSFFKLVC